MAVKCKQGIVAAEFLSSWSLVDEFGGETGRKSVAVGMRRVRGSEILQRWGKKAVRVMVFMWDFKDRLLSRVTLRLFTFDDRLTGKPSMLMSYNYAQRLTLRQVR